MAFCSLGTSTIAPDKFVPYTFAGVSMDSTNMSFICCVAHLHTSNVIFKSNHSLTPPRGAAIASVSCCCSFRATFFALQDTMEEGEPIDKANHVFVAAVTNELEDITTTDRDR